MLLCCCYIKTKADYKAFRSAFTVFVRRTFYHRNSVYPCRIWLVMTCFRLCLKNETSSGGTNSMPFLVFRRDHLRFGIICGPIWGSFPVWGSFAVGDHLRRCTGLSRLLETKLLLDGGLGSGKECGYGYLWTTTN